ncbi:sigma 54-interacting transcriptional regulator [Abyssibacter profundi]|uniref:Two-component system response regulator GlrR n=1 Tax=Abyssibacter profundi TaxID=2182787 RepID=A0A363UQ10_9GAMM|nr:sigma 54-interacting transcriptional regulator [Abyssibacter profundi]MBV60035.1 two-component system response regulator GlrR [Nevskiales bacterium]PWN57597.1 two-component system response regulator GlrR [Abyssibacter profundi]
MTDASILLVDDDDGLRRLLSMRLGAAGFDVQEAESAEAALASVRRERPAIVVTDLKMDGMDGMGLLENLREHYPGLPVILLTAHGTIPDAVEATQSGAYDFLTKPVDHAELIDRVRSAVAQSTGDGDQDWAEDIITASPVMTQVLDDARRVAATDSSVLIQGASGTGKEVLAQAIHNASSRCKKPFIAINCGAIPADLLESELFGHTKGSFTGATRDHTGLFQSAEGGTVFLDEIGDMPMELQVKLLRVLQERQIRPVGSARSIDVDVRVLSATHQDLNQAIADGRFREDLLYRLNVVTLHLPPLDERREDIPLLADHLLVKLTRNTRRKVLAPEALEWLVGADWPGNIRQLSNVLERCVALAPGRVIDAELVRRALGQAAHRITPLAEARDEFVRDYLVKLLKIAGGNVSQAARMAERNRTEFYKLLARHDVDPGDFKE